MTSSTRTLSLALLAAAALAGCASKVDLNDKAPVESRTGVTPGTQGNTTTGTGTTSPTANSRVTPVDTANAALTAANRAGRVVYFDYDSFVLKDEFKPIVDAHARSLSSNRTQRLMIEGHTDERGGREYNLALGQKRAETVVRSLMLLGAREEQLEAVSYGKERPAVSGVDESSWAQNRRAELKDRAR